MVSISNRRKAPNNFENFTKMSKTLLGKKGFSFSKHIIFFMQWVVTPLTNPGSTTVWDYVVVRLSVLFQCIPVAALVAGEELADAFKPDWPTVKYTTPPWKMAINFFLSLFLFFLFFHYFSTLGIKLIRLPVSAVVGADDTDVVTGKVTS